MRHSGWLALSVLWLGAAATTLGQPAADTAAEAGSPQSGVRAFAIDPQASSITLLLYRRGALAVFAHDHVLVASGIAGRIALDTQDVKRSSLQLSVPVGSLEIDNPEHRAREKFTNKVSPDDIEEIRGIVMSADYLDEPNHPRVTVTAVSVAGELPTLSVGLNVRIKQIEKTHVVPAQVAVEGDTLHASGELFLLQSDYGLEPYSTMLGTIAVQDSVRIRFDITARESR
jgi:polyisoprenoid-binding protein YceI